MPDIAGQNINRLQFLRVIYPNGPLIDEIEKKMQDLLEDPAIIGAIDEETEFNALVVCICVPFAQHDLDF